MGYKGPHGGRLGILTTWWSLTCIDNAQYISIFYISPQPKCSFCSPDWTKASGSVAEWPDHWVTKPCNKKIWSQNVVWNQALPINNCSISINRKCWNASVTRLWYMWRKLNKTNSNWKLMQRSQLQHVRSIKQKENSFHLKALWRFEEKRHFLQNHFKSENMQKKAHLDIHHKRADRQSFLLLFIYSRVVIIQAQIICTFSNRFKNFVWPHFLFKAF